MRARQRPMRPTRTAHGRAAAARARLACYVCKRRFVEAAPLLRFACARSAAISTTPSAQQTADLGGRVALDHRRARQDRLSGVAQAAARGRARDRHHALPGRCRANATRARRIIAAFRGRAADSRPRSAPRAERGALRALPARAAAAARLHLQQRLPDGAPAGRILPSTCSTRETQPLDGRCPPTGARRWRCTRSSARARGARPRSRRHARRRGRAQPRAGAEGCCTAPRFRSGAISTRISATARRCSRAGGYDEDLQQVDLRAVNSWRLRLHEVETAGAARGAPGQCDRARTS